MGIVGLIIIATVLFLSAVALIMAYICIVSANPMKRIAGRTVPREKIPADWERILRETVIEKPKTRHK